jgi:hypothetical protein
VSAFAQGDQGNYKLLRKGEPCPYDSGVVSTVQIFRSDTKKIRTADALIKAREDQVDSLQAQVVIRGEIAATVTEQVQLTLQNTDSLKKTVNDLSDKFNQLQEVAERPPKFFERRWVQVTLAGIGAFALGKL